VKFFANGCERAAWLSPIAPNKSAISSAITFATSLHKELVDHVSLLVTLKVLAPLRTTDPSPAANVSDGTATSVARCYAAEAPFK
jgi:hypothetical protein